ncbi:MAG: DUF2802 domain-containing protein [Gammaproteobacteria bacterium]|nr:DUF2802 domain-containing protein [Gammaproteobacteria bacterium]
MDTISAIIVFSLIGVLLLGGMILIRRQRRLNRELNSACLRIKVIENELRALYAGAAGVGTHLARVESKLGNLSYRQDQMDVHDPSVQTYNQAIEMAQRGASVTDLMKRCHLLREEAELLVRLHGTSVAEELV